MATENLDIQNFYVDSLKSNISSSTTIIPLNNTPTVAEGYLVISPDDPTKKEIIYFTSVNAGAGTVTCPMSGGRGVGNTTAQSHTSGEPIKMNIVAEYWRAIRDVIFGKMYPVGAIYISTASTEPSTLFGGTWVAMTNTFLVGKGTGTFATAGGTGGTETHTHTGPSHTHGAWTDSQGSHAHSTGNANRNGGSEYTRNDAGWGPPGHYHDTNWAGGHGHNIGMDGGGSTGATGSGGTLPPYTIVYMWKRTA